MMDEVRTIAQRRLKYAVLVHCVHTTPTAHSGRWLNCRVGRSWLKAMGGPTEHKETIMFLTRCMRYSAVLLSRPSGKIITINCIPCNQQLP